jgi:hypothetical protein
MSGEHVLNFYEVEFRGFHLMGPRWTLSEEVHCGLWGGGVVESDEEDDGRILYAGC